ncbi:hypothetical protein ACFY05_32830 [Microtetraspora fusca]|uniref:Head decoration protein n=1 Tax=Microtetraspora fusca TaxID=1997 RepID=A0ABW6VH98_MICFU
MPKFGAAIDTSQIPIRGLVPESSGTAPATPVSFQLWGDTTAGKIKWRTPGGSWLSVDDVADGAITDVKVASGAAIALSKLAVNPLLRSNHSGTQTAATISDLGTVVQAYRLDQFAAPTSALSVGGQQVTNGADPTLNHHLATKGYVDLAVSSARAGIVGVKDPVRVATQSNINLASPGANIDGVAMVVGDRFLAAGQSVGTQNGIYTWQGSSAAAVRATDADQAGEIADGTIVAVAEGTYAGAQYIQTATASGTPGSWTQTWVVYNTAGSSYVAGNGLALSGNTFSVQPADSSIAVSGSGVTVGLVPIAKGGTNATTAAQARTNLVAVTQYAADLPALTAGVAATITHNLGTEDVQIYVREATGTKARIYLDEAITDASAITLKADIAYGAGALRVTVQARA